MKAIKKILENIEKDLTVFFCLKNKNIVTQKEQQKLKEINQKLFGTIE